LIEGSVRYAQVPGGADEQQPAAALVAGKSYIVELVTRPIDGTHGDVHRSALFER
jgi:hypothetical protein